MMLFRSVLSGFLSFQIAFSSLIAYGPFAQAEAPQTTPAKAARPTAQTPSSEAAYGDIDPVWQQFADAKPTTDFKLEFSAKDPAIDQDPFFMRTQSWLENQPTRDLSYQLSAQEIRIAAPGASKLLRIGLPLTPIQATDKFIFFSLDSKSDLFARAAGAGNAPGEGLFFVNRQDLVSHSKTGQPLPVFFFPLAGQGWTGHLDSIELPQSDTLVVANQTESVAIELHDIETMMGVQQMYINIATALAIKNRGELTDSTFPARGSTAAFGLFFTGLDLDQPGKSLWASVDHSSLGLKTTFDLVAQKLNRWLPFQIPAAKADGLPPALISRLTFVGSVLFGMFVASIVIKYLHPGVRKKLEKLRPENQQNLGRVKTVRREVKETFDVFAAMTTTVAQVASLTSANTLELFLDHFAPTVAAADHTLVRRFLNNTFFFARNAIKNVPVNARTFVLGALVMGSVDTASVAIQYMVVIPLIATALMHHVSAGMQSLITETFDPANPNTKNIALQDTVRNGIAYIQSGASSYSMDARAQVIEAITKEVETQMKAAGKDPKDPRFQSERDKAIEKKINIVMKQKGLPDNSQFLFDANSAFGGIAKALGYGTPEGMQQAESFILQRRFGLTKNALAKAIKAADAWAKSDGSREALQTAALLRETASTMSFLSNGVNSGKAGIERARAARQQLTLLSYEGSITTAIKYIPETWAQQYSPEAAQAAALMFRQALYSFLSKEGDNLVFVNKKNMDAYAERAKAKAFAQILAENPKLTPTSRLSPKLRFELKLRTQVEITNLAREATAKAEAKDYAPPKLDWVARRRQERALRKADEKMAAYLETETGRTADAASLEKTKQTFVRDAFAEAVGLSIEDVDVASSQGRADYVEMMAAVDQKTADGIQHNLQSDESMSTYVEKLDEAARARFLSSLYANNFLQNYKEATTELEMVKPLDSAQPGRFQRIRQKESVRNSIFLTRTLRTFESLFDDQSMDMGWKGTLARNLPLYQDLVSTHRRMLKSVLPSLTIGYAWSYYAWQVHLPFSTWVISIAVAASTISTPSQWLNRVFRANGLKAMDSITSKIKYALPYAWVTFAGMLPIMLFSKDAGILFSDYVRTPIMSVLGQVDPNIWVATAVGLAGAALVKRARTGLGVDKKAEESREGFRNFRLQRTCEMIFGGAA